MKGEEVTAFVQQVMVDPRFIAMLADAGWVEGGHLMLLPQKEKLGSVAQHLENFGSGETVFVVIFDQYDRWNAPHRVVRIIPMVVA